MFMTFTYLLFILCNIFRCTEHIPNNQTQINVYHVHNKPLKNAYIYIKNRISLFATEYISLIMHQNETDGIIYFKDLQDTAIKDFTENHQKSIARMIIKNFIDFILEDYTKYFRDILFNELCIFFGESLKQCEKCIEIKIYGKNENDIIKAIENEYKKIICYMVIFLGQ